MGTVVELWGEIPFDVGDKVRFKDPEDRAEDPGTFVIERIEWNYTWFDDGLCCRTERLEDEYEKI